MMKKLLIALLVLVLLAVGSLFLVPWNKVFEGQLIAMLESKGLSGTTLTVEKISFNEAVLSNVSIGAETPIVLQSVNLNYTWRELLDGSLNDVTLTGVDIALTQTDAGWQVSGLPRRAEGAQSKPLALTGLINSLPISTLSIKDSTLRIAGKTVSGMLPFTLSLNKQEGTKLDLATAPTTLTAGKAVIPLGAITASAKPTQGEDWSGSWQLASVDFSKLTPMPVLDGGGALSYKHATLTLDGNLDSADNSYKAAFGLTADTQDSDANKITISAASFPFKEGRVSTRNLVIPLSGTKPITINLRIDQVSVDAMLGTLTGERVTATGTFSGAVPLIVSRDGTYTLGKGSLNADGAGTIRMSGDAIPGDNQQVALVRDILSNLQYQVLSAGVESAGGRNITVRLSLEGKNPDVLEGRPVKLNINLSGDVLDFIQQNIMLITNPEKLLEQSP